MLVVNKRVLLIVTYGAIDLFTGSGYNFKFPVYTFEFCRSLRIESNTTIKLFLSHDIFINEMYHVIKRNRFHGIGNTIGFKVEFRVQN